MSVRPASLAAAMRPLATLARRRRPSESEGSGRTPAQEQDGREPPAEEPLPPIERLALTRSAREAELITSLTGVTRCGGLLAEPHHRLLPGQRRDDNLAEVADALRAVGIAHGIVPDRPPRHRLAIAPGDRAAVLEALSSAFAGQAVYADLLEHGRTLGTVLAEQLPAAVVLMEDVPSAPDEAPDGTPDGTPDEAQAGPIRPADRVKGVRIYRPAAIGTLLYGSDTGCDVEFWDASDSSQGAVASIDETPLGWWVPSLKATATTTIAGRPYPLIDVLATDLPDQVTFPIDAVITWVDDSDPAWQERRAAARARLTGTTASDAPENGTAA
ncbi:Stealth CR1 domain-containing protein, partial [Streptomyces sp. FH025]|uniref:Stealth CR1 domain-containing protein n=1 Tax=Streptomyces sp. FH025 TaxID=2815937 RepID=UPI001A9EFDC1